MFYKIKSVTPQNDNTLIIRFMNGVIKKYDMNKLMSTNEIFMNLKPIFKDVIVDVGGYGLVWNDDIDISCNELWNNGTIIKTKFDDLISFNDATIRVITKE